MKNPLLLVAPCLLIAAAAVCGQTINEPVLISHPKVIKPEGGYALGGTVNVRVSVNENGEVTEANFLSGPGPVCGRVVRDDVMATREAAVAIARKARFTPAMNNGVPVASTTILPIEFVAPKPKVSSKPPDNARYTIIGTTDPPKELKTVSSESTVKGDPATYTGRVIGCKAFSLPKPAYPAAARAVHATGAVQVQVLIDEDGKVFSAAATAGHPLLQNASVQAACSSKFTPTLLDSKPVKVSGIIVYNFVP